MREWMKRMVSLILAVATVGSILIGAVPPAQAAQPSQADALVNYAIAQDGKTGAEIGFGNEWCAYFVAWCASNAGLQNVFGTEVDSYTKFPYPKSHAAHMLKTGRGDLFYFKETYKSIRTWESQFFTVQAPTVQTCGTPVITERGYDGGKTVTITSSTPRRCHPVQL